MVVNSYPTYLYSLRTFNIEDFLQLLVRASIYKNVSFNIDKYIILLLYLATFRTRESSHIKQFKDEDLDNIMLINKNEFINEIHTYILTNPERCNYLVALTKIAMSELTCIKDKLYTPYIYATVIEIFMRGLESYV